MIKFNNKVAVFLMIAGFLSIAPNLVFQAQGGTHSGAIRSTITGGGYTYMEIEEGGNKFWIAAPQISVKVGQHVKFSEQLWMHNFKSKALNRVFDKILFVDRVRISSSASDTAPPSSAPVKAEGRYTVEELFSRKNELNGKVVEVRGKVVKVSENIMGMSWIHIQDGTGSKGSNDIVFRSKTEKAPVGSTVTAKGTLAADKDFGMGYFYPAIVENSTFSK